MNKEVDFFYHATGEDEDWLKKMLNIIKCGAIYCKNKLEENGFCFYGQGNYFNDADHISLAAWDDSIPLDSSLNMKSSFWGHVFNLPCFIISNDIPAIKCEYRRGEYDVSKERVSQYIDEWHVEGEITLDKVVGIALPVMEHCTEDDLPYVYEILEYAKIYNWEVFVSDVNLVNEVKERFGTKQISL